jgi:predicted aspartyl protease
MAIGSSVIQEPGYRLVFGASARIRLHALVLQLLGIVLVGSSSAIGADTNAVKFELLDHHLIVVKGGIGPLEDLRLLVDTGSMPSMVDRRVAKKLTLSVQESWCVSFGQTTRVHRTVLPNVRLGPLYAEGVPSGIGDLSYLHNVDAVIGLDVLSRSSFSIDYQQKLVTFGPVTAPEPGLQLAATGPFLTVQLTVSGKPLRVIVDTGSDQLFLFERRVKDRFPMMPGHGHFVINQLGGAVHLLRVILYSVDVGGSSVNRLEAFMSDGAVDGYPAGIDGVIGLRVLAPNRAAFALEQGRLIFR